MEVQITASSKGPILKQRKEVNDAPHQYYGIYPCEHWIRENASDTFMYEG